LRLHKHEDTILLSRRDQHSHGHCAPDAVAATDGSGSKMPSPNIGRSGGRMPSRSGGGGSLPRRLPNPPPILGPRALSFTKSHAATWDAGEITTSPAEVYHVVDDDFSHNHWTPDDYSVKYVDNLHSHSCI
jgi:hypothetical protein